MGLQFNGDRVPILQVIEVLEKDSGDGCKIGRASCRERV